jgi:hypothetical protein
VGKLLVFHNCYEGEDLAPADILRCCSEGGGEGEGEGAAAATRPSIARRHPLSEHAGCAVREGEKLAFNLWFRERATKSGWRAAARQSPALKEGLAARLAEARAAQAGGHHRAALAQFEAVLAQTPPGLLAPKLLDRVAALRLEVAEASQ